jgi:EF hand domain-containing protein
MKKYVLAATSSFILLCGVMTAGAQQTSPGSSMMQHPNQQQAQMPRHDYGQEGRDTGMMGRDLSDEDDLGRSMMGEGRRIGMGHGMIGHGGMLRRGMMAQRGMMPLMRIIFALMDADGDGTVSLQEFQAAHEKIFKAMDVDKDGTVSFEEMMNFMHGSGRPPRSPSVR